MNKILKVRNVGDYSRWVGHTDRHPLVSVIDYAEVSPVRHSLNNYSIYGIFFHDEAEIDLAYGCGKYDYKKGTVICVAPGQIGGKEDNSERVMLTGWALLFLCQFIDSYGTSARLTTRIFCNILHLFKLPNMSVVYRAVSLLAPCRFCLPC